VPIFDLLCKAGDYWAPRVSACGLVAKTYSAYPSAQASSARKEIVEAFKNLCANDHSGPNANPLVRAEAAAQLGNFLDSMANFANETGTNPNDLDKYLQDEENGCNFAELYAHLLNDDHDYVKVATVKSSPVVFKYWALDSPLGGKLLKAAADKSWRVRVAVAEVLAKIIKATKSPGEMGKKICEVLMEDPESEVKHAIAERSAEVAQELGEAFAEEQIFPHLKSLVTNQECVVRERLALVIMQMAEPLGKERATKNILKDDLFRTLTINEENSNVRLALLDKNKFAAFLDVVRVKGCEEYLFETLRHLAGSPNWRVRHAVLLNMPKVAQVLKQDDEANWATMMDEKFGFKFFNNKENDEAGIKKMQEKYSVSQRETTFTAMPWAADPIAKIRADYCIVLGQMAATFCNKPKAREWLTDNIVPVLLECCNHKDNKDKYHQRIVLLLGLCEIKDYLDKDKMDECLDPVLAMANETLENGKYVPSLRMMIAQHLVTVSGAVSPTCKEKITDTLMVLSRDADPDVNGFAQDALSPPSPDASPSVLDPAYG